MRLRRNFVRFAAAALFLAWAHPSASAHAELRRATPTAGGTVATAPAEVVLNFSERLESTYSSVVVRDAVGKRVDKEDAHVDPADRTTIRVSLPNVTKGIYIVVWRALTTDTHRTEGAFVFHVGESE
jgi:methionine-rich copper-binding protein CopC